MPLERLQKIIAAAGVASRRAAEELILEGRVTINGTVVTELGTKADISTDHIKVDGKLLRPTQEFRYILINKPRGVLVTRDDPSGRPTIFTILGTRVRERLVPVGRLDSDSEGLLILTNDGALVHRLTHPSGGCLKTYEVKVSGIPSEGDLDKLRRGVFLEEGERRTAPATVNLKRTTPEKDGIGGNAWVEVILGEGRNHQVRRMFLAIGHPVAKLRRVAIGPIRDKFLKPGLFRDLSEEEVAALKNQKAEAPQKRSRTKGPEPNAPSKRGGAK